MVSIATPLITAIRCSFTDVLSGVQCRFSLPKLTIITIIALLINLHHNHTCIMNVRICNRGLGLRRLSYISASTVTEFQLTKWKLKIHDSPVMTHRSRLVGKDKERNF